MSISKRTDKESINKINNGIDIAKFLSTPIPSYEETSKGDGATTMVYPDAP